MRYLKALLSAVTLFGGHFLNRRLDRVILIFALLCCIGLASYLIFPTMLFDVLGDSSELVQWLIWTPILFIAVLAAASAILTWLDTPNEAPLTTTMQVSGVLISVFGSVIVAQCALYALPLRELTRIAHETSGDAADGEHEPPDFIEQFQSSIHFGGNLGRWDLPAPPRGPHALRGRILLDGRPAEDVRLYLHLNGKFKTDPTFTDEAGVFEIGLPAGVWHVNQVTVDRWDSAPDDRRLTLFSELDSRIGAARYSRYDYRNRSGHSIELPAANDALLELELRDAIEAEWPTRTDMFRAVDGEVQVAPADLASSVISWKPIAAAAQYEIQINRLVETEEDQISYKPLPIVRQADARLSLASSQQRTADPAALERYAIEIYAFNKEGRLLSESHGGSRPLIFELAGPKQLAEVRSEHGGLVDAGEPRSAEYLRNMERLSLASALVERNELDAARVALRDVTADAPPGRKTALLAAVEALSGDCVKALPLFERAEAEGGSGCVMPAHLELCAQRQSSSAP